MEKWQKMISQSHALSAAATVERIAWLHLNVPIGETRLRDRLRKLRNRLAVEAAKAVLKAWEKK